MITKRFFQDDTVKVAKKLLGTKLVYDGCAGIIVETEAYKTDAASHAVTRPRKGSLLRETYGAIYVYFIYGMYHCLNFTTEKNGVGAVLIRAVEPITGLDKMKRRRKTRDVYNLASGPGKVCQAFGINMAVNGETVGSSIKLAPRTRPVKIAKSPRIGISKAKQFEWRFFVAGNEFVSK